MAKFVGRKDDLEDLNRLNKFNRSCVVVIKGRRRIGKSRLVAEFAKGKRFLDFTGILAVQGTSAQDQRDHFANQLTNHLRTAHVTFSDWNDAFIYLSDIFDARPTIVLFDEISWMGSLDHSFLPKMVAWWDKIVSKHPNIVIVLCGSVSTWIEENIINSTGFFGRISLEIELEELSLHECGKFLKEIGFKTSSHEAFKLLSVTGGVPWYIEQFINSETVDRNIKRLCFSKNGLLVNEFDRIFNDLFDKRREIYKKIIIELSQGMKTANEIRKNIGYSDCGTFYSYLKKLVISGYVSGHHSWSFKTGKPSKELAYRLSDNYLRFYLKYIEPNFSKIGNGFFKDISMGEFPGWETMAGFQLENLLLKNRRLLIESIGLDSSDIVADNPFIQKKTSRQSGCQIDYLIQTKSNILFLCEFKHNKKEIKLGIISEMQEKISRFSKPRNFGVTPILFHTGEVSQSVYDEEYFYKIVNVSDFLSECIEEV